MSVQSSINEGVSISSYVASSNSNPINYGYGYVVSRYSGAERNASEQEHKYSVSQVSLG